MSLPWATFLHFGASFRDAPYTLLQSDFIASTVVCDILNASSHCDIMSASLQMCCCGSIIVALHRTTGSLPLHYLHHLPWCFLDELVRCGQSRLVDSGTMEWSHLQTLWFICFWYSSLLKHLAFILAADVTVGHLICQCDWMPEISNWSWPMAMAPLHCEGFVAPICILAFWRLHCRIMCGPHCVRSAFLVLHSLLVGSFQYQHSVHLSVYSCSANVMIGLLFLRHW
jgi:hypothetical protein